MNNNNNNNNNNNDNDNNKNGAKSRGASVLISCLAAAASVKNHIHDSSHILF